jgi:putative flavoprotein involved in K+ transport
MPFPAPAFSYPTKDEVADYLEAYATRFDLPVRTGVRVNRLSRDGNRYVVAAGGLRLEAANVAVASGAYQRPRIPTFAAELDPGILQLDPYRYRDPSQLPGGGVLVVGAGNSGAEIAFEVSHTHRTWLSGPDTGHLPVRSGNRWDRLLTPPVWWFASRVLTVQTPIGRKVRPRALTTTAPLERVRPKELAAAGVQRVPRTVGIRDGLPLLEDGRVMDVATVLWCTGFRPDFTFVDLPVFDQDGAPRHHRGVVASQPGLYFLGLWFLSSFTSSLLGGVGSDAEHIAEQITTRHPDGRSAAEVLTAARPAGQPDQAAGAFRGGM